jgi:hypothetical protein
MSVTGLVEKVPAWHIPHPESAVLALRDNPQGSWPAESRNPQIGTPKSPLASELIANIPSRPVRSSFFGILQFFFLAPIAALLYQSAGLCEG